MRQSIRTRISIQHHGSQQASPQSFRPTCTRVAPSCKDKFDAKVHTTALHERLITIQGEKFERLEGVGWVVVMGGGGESGRKEGGVRLSWQRRRGRGNLLVVLILKRAGSHDTDPQSRPQLCTTTRQHCQRAPQINRCNDTNSAGRRRRTKSS